MKNLFQPDAWKALVCYLWAGALQLGGAYYLWSVVKGNRSVAISIVGSLMMVGSALVMGLLPSSFGRVYAGYAAVLTLMALLWGWSHTGIKPDMLDIIGVMMIIGGVSIIVFGPRN